MAQFDLYAGIGDGESGYVVDLQADLLSGLATRIVAPLRARAATVAITGLTPVVDVGGVEFVVLMQEMAAGPTRELQRRIGSLGAYQDSIKRALDIVFFGL